MAALMILLRGPASYLSLRWSESDGRHAMDDGAIQNHIEELVAEEHRLLEAHGSAGLGPAEHARLQEVRVSLNRFWDLLRQRRAHEEFGQDADEASLRDAGTVEGYEG
jgi:hypothetical protein